MRPAEIPRHITGEVAELTANIGEGTYRGQQSARATSGAGSSHIDTSANEMERLLERSLHHRTVGCTRRLPKPRGSEPWTPKR